MTWVRTDDGMPLHPKVLRLSDGAYRLWSNALHFANRATTDGVIPRDLVHTLDHRRTWTSRQLGSFTAEIVATGLWLETARGFEIHDYAQYQEEALKEAKEARRVAARDRKRAQRQREKIGKSPPSHAVTPCDIERDMSRDSACDQPRDQSRDMSSGQPGMSQPPVPSRPVPSSSLRSDEDAPDTRLLVRRAFAWFYERTKATLWPTSQAKPEDLVAICSWVDGMAARERIAPEAVVERVMQHFAADDYVRTLRAPWSHFVKHHADYWQPKVATQAKALSTAIDPTRRIGVLD